MKTMTYQEACKHFGEVHVVKPGDGLLLLLTEPVSWTDEGFLAWGEPQILDHAGEPMAGQFRLYLRPDGMVVSETWGLQGMPEPRGAAVELVQVDEGVFDLLAEKFL